jgi:Tol biopolymer transport system component/tRNA A-37 threonylcarbamoyl transferase component Bud32
MGEVYKASDTRLGRIVAIKVLTEHFADDPERLARFHREAQTISSLNHPHICALHDVGDERGTYFLVMEYVDGQPLDHLIAQGPPRLADALEYATQIADALKAAHDHGIVHRDLKPGNVMITATGVKLLDFGLAKLNQDATAIAGESHLLTHSVSRPLTGAGTILGTVRYMAPEQLEGREVDARTDLYALCLLFYEMVTGKYPFSGATQASLIASILKDRPRPLTDFEPGAPPQLDRVIQTGLDKNPDARWQSAREIKHALGWIRSESRTQTMPAAAGRNSWLWKGLVAALAFALVAVLLAPRPSPVEAERRLEIWTGPTSDPTGFAVSPDARRLVYVASGPAGTQLWLRRLDADRAEPLDQTVGASHPFWSPDSQSIGFFAEGQLKRLDLVSRVTTSLAKAPSPYGGTWGTDGILFTPEPGSTILRIPAGGGEPIPVVPQGEGRGNLFPAFVGGGPRYIFQPLARQEVRLARLGSTEAQLLLPDAVTAAWHRSGYMLFVRRGALLAQRFDAAEGRLTGSEVSVADGVLTSDFGVGTALSVSDAGIVAYRRGRTTRQLAFFDRSGRQTGRSGGESSELRWPAISARGRIALSSTRDLQLWLIDEDGSGLTQLTFGPSGKGTPLWSPDGQWIAFFAFADGSLRRKRSNGTGNEETLFAGVSGTPTDWSPDGTSILFNSGAQSADLNVLALGGKREVRPYLTNPDHVETRGVFSPNSRWVAYDSNESGRFEVYVRPFPDPSAGQSRVSVDGGRFARWSRDGRELYYLSPAGTLMVLSVNIAADVFTHGTARELFRTRIAATEMDDLHHPYDVSADGRFLMRVPPQEEVSPITVLLNWDPEKKK